MSDEKKIKLEQNVTASNMRLEAIMFWKRYLDDAIAKSASRGMLRYSERIPGLDEASKEQLTILYETNKFRVLFEVGDFIIIRWG